MIYVVLYLAAGVLTATLMLKVFKFDWVDWHIGIPKAYAGLCIAFWPGALIAMFMYLLVLLAMRLSGVRKENQP